MVLKHWCVSKNAGEIWDYLKKSENTAPLIGTIYQRPNLMQMTAIVFFLTPSGAALKALGAIEKREVGRWLNNRVENSHQPFRRRERAMLRFRRMRSLQENYRFWLVMAMGYRYSLPVQQVLGYF